MAQPILIEAADDHPSTTPGASGQKVSEQRYKPYGEVRWSSGAGMPTDFTFTGQRAGPANYVGSLMDYVARAYSPALGRFVSADTIVPGAGNPQAFNRYMYVRGSPLGRIDPSGHDDDRPEDFFFNLIGGFLGGLAEANGATTFSGFERSLDVQSRDSTVHDVGRFAGNVAGVYQGLVEIAGGISGGAAGALLGCGTTVCLASPAAVALGGTITLHGAAVAGAGMQFAAKRISSRVSQQAESKQDLSNARKPYDVSKEGSDRIAKSDRFGTFFRNKNTGQWWSKDTDGHGGSVWKVFKEGSKGLTWYKDADIYGDFIEAKYKGDVGRFISWDDLKIITTP